MRILIFGLPRCGTTSLLNFLIKSLPENYLWKNEPYHFTTETIHGDDIIIKTVLCNFIVLRENETLEQNSFKLIENFDKIIYIRRKNIDKIKKSFADMMYRRVIKQREKNTKYSDCVEESNKFIDEWLDVFDNVTKGKKVYYYEDIYKDTPSDSLYQILEYLSIDLNLFAFEKHIHTKNKEVEEDWDNKKLEDSLI